MLGDNILKLRKKLGLTQEELSEKIDVTRQTISNWELNETQPNTNQLKLLSKALNISVDELIDNDIKTVVEEKVSNTEKQTQSIKKIVICIGILIMLFGVIGIASDIFNAYRERHHVVKSIELNCSLNGENYIIYMKDNNYFKCVNCPEDLAKELKEKYFDSSDLETSAKIIKFYFIEHNGSCEIKKDY